MDDLVPFGGPAYRVFFALLLFCRAMDFLSTWIATPNLVLEANPIARKLGWKWGIAVNLALCAGFALYPLVAIVVATTSLLVAARNFQSAWLMRSFGEHAYRFWMAERLDEAGGALYLVCVAAQALLTAAVGAALMVFGSDRLVPFGVGLGIVGYAVAVAFYTSLAAWRSRRTTG
jgi:hypothetical protein